MLLDEVYALGFRAGFSDASKVAAVSPAALRAMVGSGVGAVSGGIAGAATTERKGLENIRDFLIEYGIISGEKTPAIDRLYTNEFIS